MIFNKNLEDKSTEEYQVEKILFTDGLRYLVEKLKFNFININDLDIQFESTDECTVNFFATIPWFAVEIRESQFSIKGKNISKLDKI